MSWRWTAALLAVAILVSAAATLFITELWLADRILPGVQVWDVQLGGGERPPGSTTRRPAVVSLT